MMDAIPLLQCRNVTKKFGALAAVNDLSFSVQSGQILGIGGPNGAGKTALFDAISGINPCTSGEIIFDGIRIDRLSADKICHLGLSRTFQLNSGFDTLTVEENIRVSRYFGRANRVLPSVRFDRSTNEAVDNIIDLVGLKDYAKVTVRNLPVFQRKLLMIGAALATEPKLLLLDEPVGGLIHTEIDAIRELVERIARLNITVIVIEHVMRFLMQLCDSAMILHRGELLFKGQPKEILTNEHVIKVYLGEKAAKLLMQKIG
jgi:branched-chain amino acid transport system ATP-binding protein